MQVFPDTLAGRAPGQTKHRQQLSLWVFCQHERKVVIRNEYAAASSLQKPDKSASWALCKPTLLRMPWTPSYWYKDQVKLASTSKGRKSKFASEKTDDCPGSKFVNDDV